MTLQYNPDYDSWTDDGNSGQSDSPIYGDQPGDYDMPTNAQTPNWWQGLNSNEMMGGSNASTATSGGPGGAAPTIPGQNNLLQEWLRKLGISGAGGGGGLGSLLSGTDNTALFAALMGGLAAKDRQKPTGGGTASRYTGTTPMNRTMVQGKYGPIAQYAEGGIAGNPIEEPIAQYAKGGITGRFLKGPGDGVSDSIPATINGKHPAALADGEFVVPARIVSELGNGSSQAGARKLQAMVDRINKSRAASKPVAANTKAEKQLPR